MLPYEQIQQIEDWLNGTMPDAERDIFETKLRNDPAFAEEVDLHSTLMRMLQEKRSVAPFRATVDHLIDEIEVKRKWTRLLWLVAGLLALGLGGMWYLSATKPSTSALYAEAAVWPDRFRIAGPQNETVRDTAVKYAQPEWGLLNKAWTENKFDEALLQALIIAESSQDTIQRQTAFYVAGVITLSQQKPEKALYYFEEAGTVKPYSEDILWYAALAHVQIYLKNPQKQSDAIAALTQVLESRQPEERLKRASKLLKSLKASNN